MHYEWFLRTGYKLKVEDVLKFIMLIRIVYLIGKIRGGAKKRGRGSFRGMPLRRAS